MSTNRDTKYDAVVCYILNKRQGAKMIALLIDKSVSEVQDLIKQGGRIVQERESRDRSQ